METRDLKGRAHHFLRWRRRSREKRPPREAAEVLVDHDVVEIDVLFEAHEERFRTGVRERRRR